MTGKTAFIRARIEPSLKYNVEIILEQLVLHGYALSIRYLEHGVRTRAAMTAR